MGSSMFEAYMYTGDFSWVRLDKTIQILEDKDIIKDNVKLEKKLNQERARDKSIIGIIEAKHLRIKIHETGEFTAIVWSNRSRISGNWSK